MITEDYVSFEVAKLLKEKGFNEDCYAYWDLTTETKTPKIGLSVSSKNWNYKWNPIQFPISSPTQAMVMKWLREEFDLITYVKLVNDGDLCHDAWGFSIYNKFTNESIKGHRLWFKYEESAESAIKYCLENLI